MPARALGFASGLTIPGNVDLTQFVGSMVGNITAANSAVSGLRANVTATNAAIITANVGMKTYVDTAVASAVIQASGYGNSVVAAYLPVNSTITSIQANATAANATIATLTTNAASQSSEISGLRANITAANTGITALRANTTASNINISILQTATQYLSSNINGSIVSGNTYTDNIYTVNTYAGNVGVTGNIGVTGNLTVGNINASGNLIMTGTDTTTIRFVRSPDTTVTPNEIYGNIDFAGEDASPGASGVRARISVIGSGGTGQTEITHYTAGTFQPGLIENLRSNAQGTFASTIGFTHSVAADLPTYINGSGFDPVMNDGSGPGGTYIPLIRYSLTGQTINYGGVAGPNFREVIIAHHWRQNYAGFAGGDRANISLSAYHSHLGVQALANTDSMQSDVEIEVQGVYIPDIAAPSVGVKRLRKRILATTIYTQATGNYTVLDQQLMNPVYNSDATNWAAGAVASGKVLLQANATIGYQALHLRLDAPTAAASTSEIYWQIITRIRTVET